MENKTTGQKIDELHKIFEEVEEKDKDKKKIKLMRKAKVRKRKIKKGWIGVLNIGENRSISGEKEKIDGFVFNTKDGKYHTTDGREILFWEGKFPVVIQPSWKLNPLKILKEEDEKNETYGQPYIQARMLKDVIIKKSKSASMIIWVLIIGAIGYGAYYVLTKGI